jgi:hypothetical protein
VEEGGWYPLLASRREGMLAFSLRALPMAFPVAFAVLDHDVILRTTRSGPLFAEIDGQVVTLSAHENAAGRSSGRLVSVTGRAHAVTDAALAARCALLALPAGSPRDVYVRIPIDIVSTFELPPAAEPAH